MKTTKLVIGILSIVLSVFVGFQSMVAGLGNTISKNGEVGGSGGFLVAIVLLVAGIVAIATRKGQKGGFVAGGFYIVGAILGFATAGSYGDLKIWAGLCLIFGLTFIIGSFISNKNAKKLAASRKNRPRKHPNNGNGKKRRR